MCKNFVEKVDIELGEAIRMCSLYPAQVMQKNGITALLEPGHVADYLVLNNELEIIETSTKTGFCPAL